MSLLKRPARNIEGIMASVDTQSDDYWYDRVESFVRQELALGPTLCENWISLPGKLRQMLDDVIPLLPDAFFADAISTAIGLSLAAWEDYVERYANELSSSSLMTSLRSRPKLQEFLFAFQWTASNLETHIGLAMNELEERICRGEGSSPRAYARQFGVTLRKPQYGTFVRVQNENQILSGNSIAFPIYEQVSVGRRRIHTSEPGPVSFVEGDIEHRLVIADFQQVEESSREQLRFIVLTPSYVVVENVSAMIDVEIFTQTDAIKTAERIRESNDELKYSLVCGQSVTVRLPAKIALPSNSLFLYRT